MRSLGKKLSCCPCIRARKRVPRGYADVDEDRRDGDSRWGSRGSWNSQLSFNSDLTKSEFGDFADFDGEVVIASGPAGYLQDTTNNKSVSFADAFNDSPASGNIPGNNLRETQEGDHRSLLATQQEPPKAANTSEESSKKKKKRSWLSRKARALFRFLICRKKPKGSVMDEDYHSERCFCGCRGVGRPLLEARERAKSLKLEKSRKEESRKREMQEKPEAREMQKMAKSGSRGGSRGGLGTATGMSSRVGVDTGRSGAGAGGVPTSAAAAPGGTSSTSARRNR
jgi:hypothetical protein